MVEGRELSSGFKKVLLLLLLLFFNIVLMWKIVGASKVSVLYVYIDDCKCLLRQTMVTLII